jgi:hypothetical protein
MDCSPSKKLNAAAVHMSRTPATTATTGRKERLGADVGTTAGDALTG